MKKKTCIPMLVASALLIPLAHAANYTISAGTTMSATDMTTENWWGTSNNLYLSNTNSHLIIDSSSGTDNVYSLGNLYFNGGIGDSTMSATAPSLEISANTLSLSGRFQLARKDAEANSIGVLTISGTGKLIATAGNYNIGESGNSAALYVKDNGELTLTGSSGNFYIASGTGCEGLLDISGGKVTVLRPTIVANPNATATIRVTGGELSLTSTTSVGGKNGSGTLLLSGGNSTISTLSLGMGDSGNGALAITENGKLFSDTIYIGAAAGANAQVLVTDYGMLSSSREIDIARQGNTIAHMTISGNASVSAPAVNIGGVTGAIGHLTLSGGTLSVSTLMLAVTSGDNASSFATVSGGTLTSSTISIGRNGTAPTAIMTISGGSVNNSQEFQIANASNSSAQGFISGGTHSLGLVYVARGANSSGSLTIGNTADITADRISLAMQGGASGNLTISGGKVSLTDMRLAATSGDAAVANATVSGGTLSVEAAIGIGINGTNAVANLTHSGGAISAGSLLVGTANGAKATVSIEGGAMTVATASYIGHNTNTGVGTVSVTAGSLTTGTLGVKNACLLSVSGTGTVSSDVVELNSGATIMGNLVLGTDAGEAGSYVQTDALTLFLLGSQESVNIIALDAINVESPATITIDLGGFNIADEGSSIIMNYLSAKNLENANFNVLGYDTTKWTISPQWDFSNKQLLLQVSNIPESSAASLICGLAALTIALRRRK